MMSRQPTLLQLLTIPYVLLVLLTAVLIGVLSYRSGRDAVVTLSDLMVSETVGRIAQAVDRHIAGSEAVLKTVFPADVLAPESIIDEIDRLRERLWLATTIHRDPNNYAYYGNRKGQFIGLYRHTNTDAGLRLRTNGQSPRAIYTDFKTRELVGTRARRVDGSDGQFEGVAATDVSLRHLDDFLNGLTLSEHGVSFIVERDGKLLATSRGPHLRESNDEEKRRLNAAESDDPLVVATHEAIERFIGTGGEQRGTGSFIDPDGGTVQAGFARLQDAAGLDWIVAVATSRADYMSAVTDNMRRIALMAIIVCMLVALLGMYVLNRITVDIRWLGQAVRRIDIGDWSQDVPVERKDEIGEIAMAFSDLQRRLLTDRLTGIANREAIMRRLDDRLVRNRRRLDERPFALLFIDLDHVKSINDRFGHDVGDHILREFSERLVRSVRDRDLAARFGGDEFVVLLDEVASRGDVLAIAGKLQHALGKPYESFTTPTSDAPGPVVAASIGLAIYPEDGRDIETWLQRADAIMYAQKRSRQKLSAARGTLYEQPHAERVKA